MTIMIIGLLIFLGSHSVRIFAENWRQQQIAKHGETTWKVAYSAVSIVGLAIAIYGFGQMRSIPSISGTRQWECAMRWRC